MFKINCLVLFLNILSLRQVYCINWHYESDGVIWSLSCDFNNNDLGSARVPGEKCGETCAKTNGCTHFTWTDYNGGTCWMKKNLVSLNNAIPTNIPNMVCGILGSNSSNFLFLFQLYSITFSSLRKLSKSTIKPPRI